MGNLDLSEFGTPGTILVLNQTKFEDNYVEPRVGTEKDVDSLKRVFRDELKFTWEQADDLTVAQIYRKTKEYADKDYSDVDALVIVVLTHGRESGVLCAKDRTYEFIHIFDPICQSETLHNAFKWFIVQACRSGDRYDSNEQCVKLPIDPRHARFPIYLSRKDEKELINEAFSATINTVISFSTVEGRVSTRSKEEGSIMIQTLCNQLETSALAHESLLSMLCHVNRTVSSLTFEDENKTFGQTPSFKSSLLQDVLFPKLSRDQLVACGSFATSSSAQLAKPMEKEECQTSSEQPNETLDIKSDGELAKKESFGKVESYPLDEKYKYAGRAYIFHEGQKDLVENIKTLTRDTMKLTTIEKQVSNISAAIRELKQVAMNNNFQEEACFFAFVLVNFDWQAFNNGIVDLKRAFFATSCTTLASKPKIFIFSESGILKGGAIVKQMDTTIYITGLGYANQHSDMLFINTYNTDFPLTLLKTISSSRDLITLITDANEENLKNQLIRHNLSNCATNDVTERQKLMFIIKANSTAIDSTLRFPFFCIGNFEHRISIAEVDNISFVGLTFGIADPTHHFVGRLEELKQLASYLRLNASLVPSRPKFISRLDVDAGCFSTAVEEQTNASEVAEEQASNTLLSNIDVDVAVTGVQGIGKTQILLQFIHIYSKDFNNFIVIDSVNIEESFNRLMSHARTETVPGFYDYLKDKGNSLFVFENLNEDIQNISDYLPPSNVSNFRVIVVSRNVCFPNAKFELKVSSMRYTDARELTTKLDCHCFDIKGIFKKFAKNPLAVEIVCNYFKQCKEINNSASETSYSSIIH